MVSKNDKKVSDNALERALEGFLFSSRWLLAPFYVALVITLAVLMFKAFQELLHFIGKAYTATEAEVILGALTLIDLTLTGSLIVLVIFSGYENFVSKIRATDHEDWPEWMSKIDFSGLKLKLMSSIVAISAVQLLKSFMSLKNISDRDLYWYAGIHLLFVVSGVLMAWSDKLTAETHRIEDNPKSSTSPGTPTPEVRTGGGV